MIYRVVLSGQAQKDIALHARYGNKTLVHKIETLLSELSAHPRSGTGQPERLRYINEEIWSRRIDQRHRLVYSINDDELLVVAIAASGHYNNK